jgi:hypothetical protein
MAASILTPPERLNVYEIVTEKIIAQLEQGAIPWHRPWSDLGVPVNLPEWPPLSRNQRHASLLRWLLFPLLDDLQASPGNGRSRP